MVTGWPGATRMFFAVAVLKPDSVADTVYDPAPRAVAWYRPSASVVTSCDWPEVSFLMTTVTPGSTAPSVSLTTPEIDAVDCASAPIGTAMMNRPTMSAILPHQAERDIRFPPLSTQRGASLQAVVVQTCQCCRPYNREV